jgi:fatty-acyl-CoA synthase
MQSIGEVIASGDHIMEGYYKDPDGTAAVMTGEWFHTGDMAVWDNDGYIHIVDRKKEIIISGGENISSIEVEDALFKHPAVSAAAVVAKPDDKWGETPCAFIELKSGASVTSEELMMWCRQNLASYKVPRFVVFSELPKTSTGKIQKFKLREMAKSI